MSRCYPDEKFKAYRNEKILRYTRIRGGRISFDESFQSWKECCRFDF